MDGWEDGWGMDGWMDRVHGWMDGGWMDGRMDGWMDHLVYDIMAAKNFRFNGEHHLFHILMYDLYNILVLILTV